MAYIPPGVEVEQIQKTTSPTLTEPDLTPAIIGPAYKVVSITSNAVAYSTYNNVQLVVTLTNLDTATMKLDPATIHVDLVKSASNGGGRMYLETADLGAITANTVTIPASLGAGWIGAAVYVGWRALRKDLRSAYKYTSQQELLDEYGSVATSNPAGFAASQAMTNGQSSVVVYATGVDEFNGLVGSGVDSAGEHALALEALAQTEAYTLAPLTVSLASTYVTHANTYSGSTEKKERIVVVAPKMLWANVADPTVGKSTTAQNISDANSSIQEKREFNVFPDVAMKQEIRHVSTLSPVYIAAMFNTGLSFSTAVHAYLLQSLTFSSANTSTAWAGKGVNPTPGVGEEIDTALYDALVSHATETKNPYFTVFVPVPSCVALTSAIAGQVAGNPPQQGLTNMPIAGVDAVKFSSEHFSEAQLNIIAQGGTYIVRQTKPGAAVTCRHQLSTDMSSVEKRELSITKDVDYVAKFVRTIVTPFIGKYVINALVLTMIRATIFSAGEFLKKKGIVNGFTLDKLEQDANNKDTVNVIITIQPPYPVNKISIQLTF